MIPGCTTEHKNMNSKTTSTRGKHWDEEEKAIFFKGLVRHTNINDYWTISSILIVLNRERSDAFETMET